MYGWSWIAFWGAMIAVGQAQAQSSALPGQLMTCRGIADVAARAACYDRFVDANTPRASTFAPAVPAAPPAPPAPAARVAPPPAPTAPAPATTQNPVARFGADDLPAAKRDPSTAPPDQIIAKVTQVRADASDFIIVTLDNGQTWRQTDGSTLRVLPGAEVKIRAGMMGSYLMSLTTGNRSVRVKRVN